MVGQLSRLANDTALLRSDDASSTPPAQHFVLGSQHCLEQSTGGRNPTLSAIAFAVPGVVVGATLRQHTLPEVGRSVADRHVGVAIVPTAPRGVRVSAFTVIGQLLEIVSRDTSYLLGLCHNTERDTCYSTPSTVAGDGETGATLRIARHAQARACHSPGRQFVVASNVSTVLRSAHVEPAVTHARAGAPGRFLPTGLLKMHRRSALGFSALVALTMLAGCGDSTTETAPTTTTPPPYQLELSNVANSFAYQASPLRNVNGLTQYTWRNDGTIANVNQSPSNLTGTASLVVLDAAGTQVYSRSLSDNGTFVTSAGTAGMWTVRVNFSNVSGAVNFRLQRP